MKVIDYVNSVEALNSLGACKLPAKISFAISKLLLEIHPIVESYNKTRSQKVKEYGEPVKNEDGKETGDWRVLAENIPKFTEEMMDVGEQMHEITFNKISLSELGDITIEPKHLASIGWLIQE